MAKLPDWEGDNEKAKKSAGVFLPHREAFAGERSVRNRLMDSGLDRTFKLLETTPNGAAQEVLMAALRSDDLELRCRAIHGLLERRSFSGASQILQCWDDLTDEEIRAAQEHPAAMRAAVEEILQKPISSPHWMTALDALRMLSLDELRPDISGRVEACADRRARGRILSVLTQCCSHVGDAARQGRDRPSIREPLVERLAESVRRADFHRCNGLTVAFLAASAWGDKPLRQLLEDQRLVEQHLREPLLNSKLPAILQLLAGFIRRRQIPESIRSIIETRSDAAFCEALLNQVILNSGKMTQRNLHTLDYLACWGDIDTLSRRVPSQLLRPLLVAHGANCKRPEDQLRVILDVLATGDASLDPPITIALEHVPPLDPAEVLDAALAIAQNPTSTGLFSPFQLVIAKLIDAINYPNPTVHQALRKILQPLDMGHFLDNIEMLHDGDRSHLGQLVQKLDDAAIETLTEAMRSPVMERRLHAIAAAMACRMVGPLEQAIIQLAETDYREVRMAAVSALAMGRTSDSVETLQQIAEGVAGSPRDAAQQALEHRTRPF